MRRSIKIAAALTLVAVAMTAANPALVLIPLTLAIGWVKSTGRFVSSVQLSAPTVGWSIIALSVLLAGTHAFCAWVRQARTGTIGAWPWRWTCSFYCALALVLFASAAFVGIAHQTGWMITSKEPFFNRRHEWMIERTRLQNVGAAVLQLARNSEWDFVRVKGELIELPSWSSWEDYAFYFVGESNGAPKRVILLRRNPKYQAEIGVVERDNFSTRPFRDLSELLVRSPP